MRRIAVIDRDKCIKDKCGYVCQQVCPVVRMGEEAITINPKGFPVIDENLCTGCGICPKKCPVGAIKIVNLLTEEGMPLHQYGMNTFRIYNFAIPRPNSVTALVGRNGIGKSTLLQIMSGKIIPNLFEFAVKHTWEEILPRIKSKELKNYFEELKDDKSISYKVQNVEELAKFAPDKSTEEILKQFVTDENKRKEIVELLDMSSFLKRQLKQLSGGELQKLAVGIAMAKEAHTYFFDEPSTYLDIYQRIKVGKAISQLAKNREIMVVEHDLALLDYLAEYVYVLVGVPGAYGLVSRLKKSRNGINEFMEGYLKEENIRFRDYSLRLDIYSQREQNTKTLFEYPSMEKDYKGFQVKIEGGNVRVGEVIGIVGPNAIGKSSFIKMLAGELKPDKIEGELPELKIAYKPQYINIDFEGTVGELLAIEKVSDEYKTEFELNELLMKEVKRLSGGELQRLAIALTLSKDADVYLLDEPSAFLDIEQRMRLATVIHRNVLAKEKSAFVVDHDIVFIDMISSRLMRFHGQPSIQGHGDTPKEKWEGMNEFLKDLGITLRRDRETLRPKINKEGSVLDREQREKGNYYYFVKE